MNDLETITAQALSLSIEDREQLIEDLLASFSPEAREGIDVAWTKEVESRLGAYDRGEMSASTLEDFRRRLGNA